MTHKTKITAIVGMEQFNAKVWSDVKNDLAEHADVNRWTDVALDHKDETLASQIRESDCLFISMVNFKDQADWLREQVAQSKARTIFTYESMPEVMSLTKVGDYVVTGKGGMPEPVKRVAKMLVRGREEDTLYGYTKLMKLMQTMMRFMPAKARDFKNWMQVNIYWNQPLQQNVTSMFKYILNEYFDHKHNVSAPIEVPMMGAYHPDAKDYFKDLKSYREWKRKKNIEAGSQKQETRNKNKEAIVKTVALLFFRKHLCQERSYIDDTIRAFETNGLFVLPVFVTGIEGHVVVRDWLKGESVDAVVSMIGFSLIGGPAGSTKAGAHREASMNILSGLDVPYIVAQPLYVQDVESWRTHGVGPMQSAALYSLPEMDGAISPVVIGAIDNGKFQTVPDRLQRLSTLVKSQIELRHKANKEKRVAIVLYDYPPGMGKKATAALLDVPNSILNILKKLKSEGYEVGEIPATAEALMQRIEQSTELGELFSASNGQTKISPIAISQTDYNALTTPRERERVENRWGKFPGDIAPIGRDCVFLGGFVVGNIYIGVQPRIGVAGDPMRLLFDKDNAPHHQYIGFYRWIVRDFKADAIVHVGMHGSAEWMPGLQLGATKDCWGDALLGELPHLYLYPMNNPSEAQIAKRRGYATIVTHNVPPMSRAGLYKELETLKQLLNDFRERTHKSELKNKVFDDGAIEAILQKVRLINLDNDCPRVEDEDVSEYVSRLYAYLQDLENRLISGSLHVFGEAPPPATQISIVTEALKARGNGHSLASIAMRATRDERRKTNDKGRTTKDEEPTTKDESYSDLAHHARNGEPDAIELRERVDHRCHELVERILFKDESVAGAVKSVFGMELYNGKSNVQRDGIFSEDDSQALQQMLANGREMTKMLGDNRSELDGLLRGLAGRYVLPAPGGDLIRDGLNVLPTGRNVHAIDPYRIPSELATARGEKIADAILEKHLAENNGVYPQTIAQVLWGLDTIKTKGESVAICLKLIGARVAYDGQGKISNYELIPLSELKRPRIDVLMNLSPIFRDNFEIVMDLLDRLVKDAARADEPNEMNYVKKHVNDAMRSGLTFEQATARLFTQQAGQYGTYVDDMVDDSAWESKDDLDATFVRRNSFAYGGGRHGERAPLMLQHLLGTVGRVVQEIDSVEFGVSDIDHYFSSSGALQMAAKKRAGANVKLSYVEAYTAETRIDDVDKVLRMEYRTKLLNPRWHEGMLQHGHGGAAEISNRFTYMLGWDAVSDCVDDWVYTDAANTFALDTNMRERLEKANPKAMRNIVGRLLEANGRGLWKADDKTIDELKGLFADLEDRLEGIN